MPEIQSGLTMGKVNALPTVLSLQPNLLFIMRSCNPASRKIPTHYRHPQTSLSECMHGERELRSSQNQYMPLCWGKSLTHTHPRTIILVCVSTMLSTWNASSSKIGVTVGTAQETGGQSPVAETASCLHSIFLFSSHGKFGQEHAQIQKRLHLPASLETRHSHAIKLCPVR